MLPRWWSVTRNELHAVALYQRSGEGPGTIRAGYRLQQAHAAANNSAALETESVPK
jgi:hypothetical protein